MLDQSTTIEPSGALRRTERPRKISSSLRFSGTLKKAGLPSPALPNSEPAWLPTHIDQKPSGQYNAALSELISKRVKVSFSEKDKRYSPLVVSEGTSR